ncbi:MAG: murein biosynthesis integral membrane protein MurJ [Thermosynechococcaceae cyanobacterium MS004]|nr:murein biosynthesis integral membrane protein MurJ [Thermosynechococcaceae cyanobacterium MS004]
MSETPKPVRRSLVNIAAIVAIATLISKIAGLLRQQAIAAAFGVGPVFEAYNFSYVIPGFFLILLGGINGPFHSAMVSVLAKRSAKEAAPLVETITTLVSGVLILVTIALMVFAQPLLQLVAPGLFITLEQARSPENFQLLQQTQAIAIEQLRIMAPMALLAGLIGIGFGSLNAADQYWLPSVSPLLSSLTVILGIGGLLLTLGSKIIDPQYVHLGGLVLAYGTLAGAILQWLVQVPAQWKANMGGLRLRFNFREPGVAEVLRILGPATFSSGMMQINVYTDLFFASYIPGAASALGYSTLLVQTPLGILSNVILVPLLPIFSRLADPTDWTELKSRIRQGMMLTAVTMLPLGALMMALAYPIVQVVYERYAFDRNASDVVAPVLIAYSLGMFVYLGRDVLVRVFYALGDGDTPFRISMVNIFINALMDFVFVRFFDFGAPGLVLATVSVNVFSMIALLWILNQRLNGLNLRSWVQPIVGLTGASVLAGLSSWGIIQGIQLIWGKQGFLGALLSLSVAGLVGLLLFGLVAARLKVPEFDLFIARIKDRLPTALRR